MNNYTKALERYFQLKNKYETRKTQMCVGTSCKTNTKSLFDYKNGIYSVVCGSDDEKCGLDIRLKKGIYVDKNTQLELKMNELYTIQKAMTEMKVKLMYNEITDSDMITLFEAEKQKYISTMKDIEKLEMKNDDYNIEKTQLHQAIQEINKNIIEYLTTNEIDLIKEVIEIHVTIINGLVDTLHESYELYKSNNEHILLRNKYEEIELEKPEIISNKLK